MFRSSPLLGCLATALIGLSGCSEDALETDSSRPSVTQQESDKTPAADELKTQAENADLPNNLLALFQRLDELGRGKIQNATFVEFTLGGTERADYKSTKSAWLIEENDQSVEFLQDDLISWVYNKKEVTKSPSSWQPASMQFKAWKKVDFESICKKMSKPEEQPKDEFERMRLSMRGPGPSHRLLIAHAAWKKGLTGYVEQIVALDPEYKADFEKYKLAALEDLAWLHFLRGVNLLMFADRTEALQHLRLVSAISSKSEFKNQADDLVKQIERLLKEEKGEATQTDESKLSDSEKAKLYISQLRGVHCPQSSQPGFIGPYMAVIDGKPSQNPPTAKLREMGMSALPALVQALEDDTPTRTVYHWRDFHRSRRVWRGSDFAWTIIRDITKKEFGYRRVVGFTFNSMKVEEKKYRIEEIRKWYEANKNQTPDDRMLAFFSSNNEEDWMTAAQFFLKKKDNRAVQPLLEKIPSASQFAKGDLCELVAKFGDPIAKPIIRDVLKKATEASDRLSAAIALWELGDKSGVPVVVEYVKAKEQPYGSWDEPVWFLMHSHTKEGIEGLKSVVTGSSEERASEVFQHIFLSITGDLWGKDREPAGCLEICPLLIAMMDQAEYTGGSINDIKTRQKDVAAKAFVLLREGLDDQLGGRFAPVDEKLFNELEPDESKRDAQIDALKKWYDENKGRLVWDSKKRRLMLKSTK